MSFKGKPQFKPRATEAIARETITGLFIECMELMRSPEPQAWEVATRKFEEAASYCRVTEKELRRRVADEAQLAERIAPHRVMVVMHLERVEKGGGE